MSDAPATWFRRIRKPLVVVLAVLLYLGTATALGTWWLWPPQPHVVLPDSDSANHIAFSGDGALVAALSNDDTILVWETATGRLRFVLPGAPSATALLFSPDSRLLAARGERLKLFDLATGDERPLALARPGVAHAAFSPDGKALLVTAGDGSVSLVDLATGVQWSPSTITPPPRVQRGAGDSQWVVVAAAPCRFSLNGQRLVWEEGGSLRVFNVPAHEQRAAYPGTLEQLAFAPDGETWAVAAENEVQLCAAPDGEERAVLRGHSSPVKFLAWSPDGQRLASVAGREIKLWDVKRGEELATLRPDRPDCAVRFSPDGRFLCLAASGFQGQQGMLVGRGESIPLWDLSKSPPEHVASVASANVMAPDNRVLAAIGDPDRPVDAWTIARRVPATTWEVGAASEYPAFTPDGKMVILAGHTTIVRGKLGTWLARGAADGNAYQYKWVDVDTWQTRAVLDTDVPGVLSPDGRLLATGGGDKPARLWRVPPRRPAGPSLVLMGLIAALAVAILYRRRRRGRPVELTPVLPPPA
jgi:WD40 repeat protein